jgi:hypothetical protein
VQPPPRSGIHIGVPQSWIELVAASGARRRHELKPGLTVIGGEGGDIPWPASGSDQLHIWDQPPKLIFVGGGPAPLVNGQRCDERDLRAGDAIEWQGLRLEFGGRPLASIQEIPLEPRTPPATVASAAGASLVSAEAESSSWKRIKAGLLVELGLADVGAARRWQEAIARGEFEADSCARDVLNASTVNAGDARVLERCGRLQRDLVMSPLSLGARGGARRLRSSASNWLAMALMQFVVLGVCVFLVLVALFVMRVRWEWSVDGFFDSIAETLSGS